MGLRESATLLLYNPVSLRYDENHKSTHSNSISHPVKMNKKVSCQGRGNRETGTEVLCG